MIRIMKEFFLLETRGTAYCFRVTEQGFLQHLYYGRRLDLSGGWEALVPQVRDATTLPVIAAGGIACARQLRAAFALGAVGVQVGTCLLVAEECPIHQNYKEAILRAKDTDTVVTGRIGGTPVRVLKNRMAREYVKREKAGADKMELETFTLGGLRRAVLEGDTENGSLMAGQVAGMCGAIRPVAEILAELAGGVPPLSCHAAGDHPKGA